MAVKGLRCIPLGVLIIIGHTFCLSKPAHGTEVMTLISKGLLPYTQAYEGFSQVIGKKGTVLTLDSKSETTENVITEVLRQHPRVLHVIGTPAARIATFEKLPMPVVFSMILNPEVMSGFEGSVAGCIALPSPEELFSSLLRILPKVKRIGTVYNPQQTGFLVQAGIKAARTLNVELIAVPVSSLGETLKSLETLTKKVDALWMLPDPAAFGQQSFEYLLLLSFRNRVPVIAVSEKYVSMGALMALKVDYKGIGRQSGQLVMQFLEGRPVEGPSYVFAQNNTLVVNLKTAETIGIKIPKTILEDAVAVSK